MINNIKIYTINNPQGAQLAFCSFECNGFFVNSAKIMRGSKGLFVSMPQRPATPRELERDPNKKWVSDIRPNRETMDEINNIVLAEFGEPSGEQGKSRAGNDLPF